MEELNDTTLVARCRKGDERAFEVLYHRYRLPLFGYLNRLLIGRRDQVDDIFQQVWIRAAGNWHRYDDRQRLLAWLCRIGHNLVMDFYRGEGKREFVELTEQLAAESPPDGPDKEALDAALQRAISLLPANQREVVELRTHGVSFQEIANRLGLSLNTALGRMHYAVLNLRKHMMDENGGDLQ